MISVIKAAGPILVVGFIAYTFFLLMKIAQKIDDWWKKDK